AGVVRHWIHTDRLQDDHRRAPSDNAEEDIVLAGPLKHDVEPEAVAIERKRGGDIPYDEERRNASDFWFRHVRFLVCRTFTTACRYREPQSAKLSVPRFHIIEYTCNPKRTTT